MAAAGEWRRKGAETPPMRSHMTCVRAYVSPRHACVYAYNPCLCDCWAGPRDMGLEFFLCLG